MADDSKMTSLADLIKSISEGKGFKGRSIDPGFIMKMPDPYEGMSEEEKEMRKAINKIMTDRFTVEPKKTDEDIPEWLKEARKKFSERFYKRAGGGIMDINRMTAPLGYREAGEVGIRERIYDMLAPNEKMSDEELRLQGINPSSVLPEERPQAEGRPEGVLQGLFRELIGAKKAEGSDLSSMAAMEILKLDEEIKLLRIDQMLNPDNDNSKSIQGKMNLREYYESLGN